MLGRTVSHYCILAKLGGGMGVVYKAEDTMLGARGGNAKCVLNLVARDNDFEPEFARLLDSAPDVLFVVWEKFIRQWIPILD
jgi:hypothetical protein